MENKKITKKTKYRKKKKATIVKSLTALKAAQNVKGKSEPKQKITYISDNGTIAKYVNGVREPLTSDDPKTLDPNKSVEIELELVRVEDLEKNVVMFDKDLGIDLYAKNPNGTNSLALGSENATNTLGPFTNDSHQAASLSFWQRILTFLGIRRSK